MPTIRVEIPSRNQLIEFDEGTPESVIQDVIKREFPRNGNDVAYEVAQLPGFSKKISDEDFVLYEDYLDKKKTDYVSAFAGGVSGIAETVGKGVAGIFQLRNLDPRVATSTAIEGAAQGTRDLYGMVAQSTDPTSYMFKFTNWLNGTGTVQDRKSQWIEANEFTERSGRITRGEEAIVPGINPAFVNADVRNAIGLVADPSVLIPGLNVSAVGAKAVGAGLRAGGRFAQTVTRPLVSVIDRVGEVASEALGTKLDSVRNVAAGTGISGLALGVPGVSQAAAVIGGVEAVSKLGRVAEQAGEQLVQAPTRIGPLESIGRAPNATSIDRALGRVGRFGGDDLIDIGTRSLAGAVEGAVIGGGLGYLSQGEEGLAAGIGSGGTLGAGAAGLVRGVQKASGVAARQARENDFKIFRDGLDEADQSKFDTIVKNSGIDGAVQVMDTAGIIRGKFNDAEIQFLTAEEFEKEGAGNTRGVQVVNVEAQRPVIKINVDKISSQRTAFHELFHVFKAIDNLRPAAEKVERTIVGNWIIGKNGESVQTSPGFMDEAQILSRFDEYVSKLPENNPARKINTVAEKAAFVGEELASEYMSKMIAGSSTDSMLRGFDDFTRTIVDRALLNNNEGFLRRTAQSLGLGSKPIESLLFKNLQEASPALNAQLRDMVRMRRNMDKKLELADEVQVTNIQKKDLSNPVAAQLAVEMNIAEKGADGVTRMKLDDVMSQEDKVSLDSLKSVIKSTPVADVNAPRMRELDGKIVGDGISDAQLAAIQSSPNILDKVKQSFALIKSAIENGEVLYIRNGKATKKITSRLTGKTLTRYNDGVRMTERKGVPYSLAENKAGELYLNLFDISKARRNAMDLASKDRLGPYQADFQAFYGDLVRYLNNLSDPVNRVPSKELLGDAAKAAYLTDFFGQKEGDGKASKFIRSLTLDRMVEMRPTGERVRMTESAYDLNKARFMPAELSPEQLASLESAKRYHGITKNIKEAGYALPNGSLLDFSGRHQMQDSYEMRGESWVPKAGKKDWQAGSRNVDHREIQFDGTQPDGTSGGDMMVAYQNLGAMRIDATSSFVDMEVRPTSAQESVIRRIAEQNNGDITVDLHDGNRKLGLFYEGAKPQKVLGDIRRFYSGEDLKSGARFMPAENLGETKVFDAPDSGFRIIAKGNKHSLYAPTGERLGIYDTQAGAERKANITAAKLQPEIRQQQSDSESFTISRSDMGRFMPASDKVKLEDYADRKIIALAADRMGIGQMSVGPKGEKRDLSLLGQGGRGFMNIFNGGGWAFSDQKTADRFISRLKKDADRNGNATVGITIQSPINHLKNQTGQLAYIEAMQAAIDSKTITRRAADAQIAAMSSAIVRSEAKDITGSAREKFSQINTLKELKKVVKGRGLNFDDMSPLLTQMQRKKLPITNRELTEMGMTAADIARDLADPELADLPFGSVVALLGVNVNQTPSKTDFHYSYPWTVHGEAIGFLDKFYNISDLSTEKRIRNAQGAVTAQPLQMVMPVMDNIINTIKTQQGIPSVPSARFMPSEIKPNRIEDIAAKVGGGNVSGGAKRFGAFMQEMKDKDITVRDVIKSYGITLSSIQRGEQSVDTVKRRWPDAPFEAGSKVRPEDAFAALLGTVDGQRYLDAAEQGKFDSVAAEKMIEKFATFGLQNKLLVSLKDAAEKFYPKAEEIISAVRSMPASEYSDYVRQNFPGISYGKVGFMSGQLGRGDLPTFDSRQKQLVYGRDVNVTKERLLEQRDRLLNLGIKVPEKYKEFAQTLLHHEVWDRLNKSDTEHGEIKNAMLKFMPDDAGYLSAVKSGDTKAQQQMVDEAAKAAGYSVGPVYHGTGPEKFNVFEETTGDTGFFFASQKGDASGYGDRIIPAFLKMGRNYQVTAAEFEAGGVWGATQAKEQGYDSFTMDYGDGDVNHAVFNPSQIKSADPITRDAQGNVIPLSQRFNQGSEDIRFMPEVKFFAPEKLPNGQAWSTDMNYRVIQKTGGKYRVYAPIGTLIGVTESLEQAKRLVEKRNK